MKISNYAFAAFASGGTLLVALSGSATQYGEIHPGSQCAGENEFDNQFSRSNGRLRNASGNNGLLVECPINRDRLNVNVAGVSAVVTDATADNDLHLLVRTFDGGSIATYIPDDTQEVTGDTSNQQIRWLANGGAGEMPTTLSANQGISIRIELDNNEYVFNYHMDVTI